MQFFKPVAVLIILFLHSNYAFSIPPKETQNSFVIIIQPIVVQGDDGNNPASMALPKHLINVTFSKAHVGLHFLEPIFYGNTKARDGVIDLDKIVKMATEDGFIRGQGEILNLFFVNELQGKKGPVAHGMMNESYTFIALGTKKTTDSTADILQRKHLQALVITHEVTQNLGLKHSVNRENISNDIANIQTQQNDSERSPATYSLNDYQIRELKKSPLVRPRIDILAVSDARKAILDETFEPYFSKLQKREIETFIQEKLTTSDINDLRRYARKRFQDAVLPFSETERNALTYIVKEVNVLLLQNNIHLMANHPWRFIKVDSWLCGGFAHTRGSFIIFSQKHLDSLTKIWQKDIDEKDRLELLREFGGLLVHEQMHALQRSFPSKFDQLNTQHWDFQKAIIESDEYITLNQVSNPDAPSAEWLVPKPQQPSEFYWVRTLLKEGVDLPQMGKDFMDQVFTVILKEGKYQLKRDYDNKLMINSIDDLTFYRDYYPVTRGIDHPNEISAYMFSKVFRDMVSKTKDKPELKNEIEFDKWIELEMSKPLNIGLD
jgi:hypothetical protein